MVNMGYRVHMVITDPKEKVWHERFWKMVDRGMLDKWTATRQFRPGDLALFYLSDPVKAIVAVGRIASEPVVLDPAFPNKKGTPRVFCSFEPVVKLTCPIPYSVLATMPKKVSVQGTGRISMENVNLLLKKVFEADSEAARLLKIN